MTNAQTMIQSLDTLSMEYQSQFISEYGYIGFKKKNRLKHAIQELKSTDTFRG